MAPLNLAFKATTGGSVPSHRDRELPRPESQERTLYVDSNNPRVLIEPTRDGNDYRTVCARHQWASHAVPYFADLGDCPECVAEIENSAGRRRYADLHGVNVRIVGTV